MQMSVFPLIISIIFFASTCFASPYLKDYGSLPTVSLMTVSPDGLKVAFRKVEDDKDQLIVVSLREKKIISGVNLTAINPHQIKFLDDENIYLKASKFGRVAGFRGKFETSTGFSFNLVSNQIRQLLVPGEYAVYPGQSGLGQIVGIAPDRNSILMPAFVGSTDLILGKPADPTYSLLRVRVDKKARHKQVTSGSSHTTDFFVNSEGELIAEERYDQKKNEHSLWAKKGGAFEKIYSESKEIRSKTWVGLTNDSRSVVYTEVDDETGRLDYFLLDIQTGKVSRSGLGRSDADIEAVIFDDNRVVQGVRYSGFNPSYKLLDPNMDARVQKIIEQFPEQSVWIVDQSSNWKNIVVYVEGSNYAGEYYLASAAGDLQMLARSRPSIAETDINPIGKITLQARDGLSIPTLLTIPKERLADFKKLPAVIYPHGGPRAYDRIAFDFFAQALASEGYLVVQPQFRGSSGFGAKHAMSGNGEWGRKMQDDITDTLKALSKKGLIDSSRVCILGMSYGGFAALAGGALTPELYRCVVSINGVSDLQDLYQFDKFEHGQNHEVVTYMEMQFAANRDGAVDKAEMKVRSPIAHSENFSAPVLLIHAANDEIVPLRQSTAMRNALKKMKKQVDFIELEGDSHYLENNGTRLIALESSVKFINSHLKK